MEATITQNILTEKTKHFLDNAYDFALLKKAIQPVSVNSKFLINKPDKKNKALNIKSFCSVRDMENISYLAPTPCPSLKKFYPLVPIAI